MVLVFMRLTPFLVVPIIAASFLFVNYFLLFYDKYFLFI